MGQTRIKPKLVKLSRINETEELYRLERQRDELIKSCARAWLEVMGLSTENIFEQGVAQALFDTLESFESRSSIPAAQAYLELYGYKVTEEVS